MSAGMYLFIERNLGVVVLSILVITTGGTIDKVYFDAASEFQVGDSAVHEIFKEANVNFEYEIQPLMRKDSLEMTDADRQSILAAVTASRHDRILVTHGTDTMAATAEVLKAATGKTIVLTGAMQPARLRYTDAIFNIGFAVASLQSLPSGVYICMNGQIFAAGQVKKNRSAQRFEVL